MDLFESYLIPLERVKKEHIETHKIWQELSVKSPITIKDFVLNAETSSFPLTINLNRFKSAVGIETDKKRLGLVFKDICQQDNFADEFKQNMIYFGYKSFSLVATGSSFQGLSSSPKNYKEFGYMKVCGESAETDLDLQLYCKELCQKAAKAKFPAFVDHFTIVSIEGSQYAKLTTFDNKTESDSSPPYIYLSWLKNFENKWSKILKLNFQGTGVNFNGINIALMIEMEFIQSNNIGSPYELCRVSL